MDRGTVMTAIAERIAVGTAARDAVPSEVTKLMSTVPLWNRDAVTLKPIAGGLTNSNWLVHDEKTGIDYFFKIPGPGTEEYIDRATCHQASVAASESRVGAGVLFFDPSSGIEVTEFLTGYQECTTAVLNDPVFGAKVVDIFRELHATKLYPQTKTLFDMTDEALAQVAGHGVDFPGWVQLLFAEYADVKNRFLASGLDLVPSHNDPMPGNFMVSGEQMKIIDFDFAANNESSSDLALFLAEMFYEESDASALIERYFGSVTAQNTARVQALRFVGDVKWGLWGVHNSFVRAVEFDYWKYGMWKLGRASQFFQSFDWDTTKGAI
jgi:thiamine kinase-like enzyme